VSEQFCRSRSGQSVIFQKGTSNKTLVERAQRALRRIGQEQSAFVIGSRSGRLDDDRNLFPALGLPSGKTLETINDFKRVALGRDHP